MIAAILLMFGVGAASAADGACVRARGRLAEPAYRHPPSSPSGERVLLQTNFESGIIPSDWRVQRSRTSSDSLPGSWFVAPTDGEVAIGEGQFLAWVNWDSTQTADEWLITPRIDLSDPGIEEVALDFLRVYHDPARWAEEATLTVLASRDDGASFPDTLYRVTPLSPAGRERVSIDLSGYAGGFLFRAAFLYSGIGGDSAGIDDVAVRVGLPVRILRRSWGRMKAGRGQ